jgi:hypothetical protein
MSKKRNDWQYNDSATIFQALFMPVYRIPKSLFSRDNIKEYKYKRNIVIDVFGLTVLLAILFLISTWEFSGSVVFAFIAYGIIGIVVLGITMRLMRSRKYNNIFTAEGYAKIDIPFDKALKIMDNTAKWYRDENEANRELVTCLRTMNIDAEYQFRLSNGRIADARVKNILVEGKLSPNTTSEVDGLFGQLIEYTNAGYRVNVVIYGKLEKLSRDRIENEIKARYKGKVFLTYLDNPRRLRVNQI